MLGLPAFCKGRQLADFSKGTYFSYLYLNNHLELSTLHLLMQTKKLKQSLGGNFTGRNFYRSTYQKPLSIYAVLPHDFLTVLIL